MPAPRVRFGPLSRSVGDRLAAELVAARAVAGLTQRQVAVRAGISQSLVSQIERRSVVPSVETVQRLAAATGHDLSLRLWPAGGVRLRDSGQLGIARLIRDEIHPGWEVALEVPVGPPPDRRAADMVLTRGGVAVVIEIERGLLDLQAQLRAAQLKRAALTDRVGHVVHLILALPDTAHHRTAAAAHGAIVRTALPVASRRLWVSLRSGTAPAGDGLLWVRSRRAAAARAADKHS